MAVVAVMVLIVVLFLSGTVMALAVSSNFHTVDVLIRQDAIHYAAESAVARGLGSIEWGHGCPRDGDKINGLTLTIRCQKPARPGGTSLAVIDAVSIQRWASRPQRLRLGECASIDTHAESNMSAWAVVAWRGTSGSIKAWMNNDANACNAGISAACDVDPLPNVANVSYVSCNIEESQPVIHVGQADSAVDLGALVVRALVNNNRPVWTVVGIASGEVDEADFLPGSTVTLWNTVLP
jgi:hypothetical protein